jgi:predicted  nucleic acid-binding Zn-ribbon protein
MRRSAAEKRVNALSVQITEVLAQKARLEKTLNVSETRMDSMREQIEAYKALFGNLPPKRAR